METNDRIVKTYGVVIAENNSGDYNRVITILTSKFGKITAIARGARRTKSNLLASTSLLSFAEFVLFKGHNMYYINSADIVDIFYDIRNSYEKLETAFEILKLIDKTSIYNEDSKEILEILVSTIYAISNLNKPLVLIITVFKIKLMFALGYGINFKKNNITDVENKLYTIFNNQKGELSLENIMEGNSYINIVEIFELEEKNIYERNNKIFDINTKYILNKKIYNIMKYVVNSEMSKMFSFNLDDEILKELQLFINILYKKYMDI